MAISVVAVGTAQQAVNTGTASISVTPTLPAGSVSGDRVYLVVANSPATTTPTTPASWTSVDSQSVGTGTLGSNTGPRRVTVFWRDYDGAWTMPTVTLPSVAAPALLAQSITVTKAAGETWNAPTSTFGSDTTVTGTSFSVTGGANLSYTTGNWAMVADALPGGGALSAGTLAATGATFGTVTEQADWPSTGATNAVHAAIHEALVTAGPSSAAPVHTATAPSGVSAGGAIFVRQTVSAATPLPRRVLVSNPAVVRKAYW